MIATLAVSRLPLPVLHAGFAPVQSALEDRVRQAFARLRCPHDREDASAEAALRAWQHYLRTVAERLPVDPPGLARRAVEAVRRRLCRRGRIPSAN